MYWTRRTATHAIWRRIAASARLCTRIPNATSTHVHAIHTCANPLLQLSETSETYVKGPNLCYTSARHALHIAYIGHIEFSRCAKIALRFDHFTLHMYMLSCIIRVGDARLSDYAG